MYSNAVSFSPSLSLTLAASSAVISIVYKMEKKVIS